jgi:hypothetical protein
LNARPQDYAKVDIAIGAVFGAIALYLLAPQPLPTMIARAINEGIFPLGCTLVIYAADIFGKRTR